MLFCLNYLITKREIFILSLSTHCYKIRAKWNKVVTQLHNNYSTDMIVNITKLKCCLAGIITMYSSKYPFICWHTTVWGVVWEHLYIISKGVGYMKIKYIYMIYKYGAKLFLSLPVSVEKKLLLTLPERVGENCSLDASFFIVITTFYF